MIVYHSAYYCFQKVMTRFAVSPCSLTCWTARNKRHPGAWPWSIGIIGNKIVTFLGYWMIPLLKTYVFLLVGFQSNFMTRERYTSIEMFPHSWSRNSLRSEFCVSQNCSLHLKFWTKGWVVEPPFRWRMTPLLSATSRTGCTCTAGRRDTLRIVCVCLRPTVHGWVRAHRTVHTENCVWTNLCESNRTSISYREVTASRLSLTLFC